jgi:rubredoxin
MPTLPCPACGASTPRNLDTLSAVARVNYYRCPVCAHVWTVSKDDPTDVQHITPLPPQKDS